MIELYLVVFLACGKPVFVVMQTPLEPMRIYSQESMGTGRWSEFLKIIETSKGDPAVARLELPVEEQIPLVCAQTT